METQTAILLSEQLAYATSVAVTLAIGGLPLLLLLKKIYKVNFGVNFKISKKTFENLEIKPLALSALFTWLLLNFFGIVFGSLAPFPINFALFFGGFLAIKLAQNKRLVSAFLSPFIATLIKFLFLYHLGTGQPLNLEALIYISFGAAFLCFVAGGMGGLYALFFYRRGEKIPVLES